MSKKFLLGSLLLLLIACRPAAPPAIMSDSPFAFSGRDQLPAGFDAQGHRGARGLLPENTLPAFEAALDLGVSTLELDLHYTQDGVVVVWHDPILSSEKCRLPDGSPEEVPDLRNPLRRIFISQQPLSNVQQYRCDLNPDPDRFPEQQVVDMPLAGTDYTIPSLSALFEFVALYAESPLKSAAQRANAAQVQFNIETKRVADAPENIGDGFTGGEAGPFELAILDLIAAYELEERVSIQSFDHRSLRVIREINPDIRLAALTTRGEAKLNVYAGYQFNIWSPNHNDVTAERVAEAQALGLQVVPWTVNEPQRMTELIALGVDGLISDRPDLLLEGK